MDKSKLKIIKQFYLTDDNREQIQDTNWTSLEELLEYVYTNVRIAVELNLWLTEEDIDVYKYAQQVDMTPSYYKDDIYEDTIYDIAASYINDMGQLLLDHNLQSQWFDYQTYWLIGTGQNIVEFLKSYWAFPDYFEVKASKNPSYKKYVTYDEEIDTIIADLKSLAE